jgi:hypothetical protein
MLVWDELGLTAQHGADGVSGDPAAGTSVLESVVLSTGNHGRDDPMVSIHAGFGSR